ADIRGIDKIADHLPGAGRTGWNHPAPDAVRSQAIPVQTVVEHGHGDFVAEHHAIGQRYVANGIESPYQLGGNVEVFIVRGLDESGDGREVEVLELDGLRVGV